MIRSNDLRTTLLRGTRHWHLLALPITLLAVAALLTDGNRLTLAPPTGALITNSVAIQTVPHAVQPTATLVYADPGDGERSTLHLPVSHSTMSADSEQTSP